jgi:hypothetical protein
VAAAFVDGRRRGYYRIRAGYVANHPDRSFHQSGRPGSLLVSGPAKAKTVRDLLQGEFTGMEDETRLPALLIDPASGRLRWLLDEEWTTLIAKESTQ